MVNGYGKPWRGEYSKMREDHDSLKGVVVTNTPRPGETPEQTRARDHSSPAAATTAKPNIVEPSLHTDDSAIRKQFPIAEGVLDYFPDAVAYIAMVSFIGNQQHNPGEPMHWAREKSGDHANCIARHLLSRGTKDSKGVRHSGNLAWRALANLQEELERDLNLPCPKRATPLPER